MSYYNSNISNESTQINRQYDTQSSRSQVPDNSSISSLTSSITIKIGMLGDPQIGKTTLMVKYVEGKFEPDYIQTLGVNFMEKTIMLRSTRVTFSIWDLGGEQEFVNMLPLVCNDATAILFMYDLTRRSTLNSIRTWYKQARGFNSQAIPILVGTKYDEFVNSNQVSPDEQVAVTQYSRALAKAMDAPLIFCSSLYSINVNKIFKIILSKAFDLALNFDEISDFGAPILEFK